MVIFNLETNKFEIYSNQSHFMAIQIDQERKDFKEVIHLFDRDENTFIVTALNNEEDESLEKCLEEFSQENKTFILYLDFFRVDNIHRISQILN